MHKLRARIGLASLAGTPYMLQRGRLNAEAFAAVAHLLGVSSLDFGPCQSSGAAFFFGRAKADVAMDPGIHVASAQMPKGHAGHAYPA